MRTRLGALQLTLGAFTVVAAWGSSAAAHIRMEEPVARNVWADSPSNDPIKVGPCGSGAQDVRTTDPDKINVFAPGETITVSWYETINHPGHFRIAFDPDGQDDFVDITGPTDIVDPPVLPVLLDGIPDGSNGPGTFSVEVTLPDMSCDNCTLQLIQYMTDRNEPYYVCADLVLVEDSTGGDGDTSGGSGGSQGTDPVSSGGASAAGGGGTSGSGSGGAQGSGVSSGGASFGMASGGQSPSGDGMTTTGDTTDPLGENTTGTPAYDDSGSGSGCSLVHVASKPNRALRLAILLGAGVAFLLHRRRGLLDRSRSGSAQVSK